jgi:hypothetical protein
MLLIANKSKCQICHVHKTFITQLVNATHKSVLKDSDDGKSQLKLQVFWTLSVVWCCNTTFRGPDLFPSSGGKVPAQMGSLERAVLSRHFTVEWPSGRQVFFFLTIFISSFQGIGISLYKFGLVSLVDF